MLPKHSDISIKSDDAKKQQEAIKAIMKERRVPFERAVDIYIYKERPAERKLRATVCE